jgi:hypothetical protein
LDNNNNNSLKGSFRIAEYLTRPGLGVTRIAFDQRNLVVDFTASRDLRGHFKVVLTGNWETDKAALTRSAQKKGFDTGNIDLLVKGISEIYAGDGADIVATIKEKVSRGLEAQKKITQASNAENNNKRPHVVRHYLQKYHAIREGNELYEAVIINGDAYFVCMDRDAQIDEGRIKCRLESGFEWFSEKENTITKILPKENLTYINRPYQFESQVEIDDYLNRAQDETLDSLYKKVKGQGKKYIDSSDTHLTILASDTIFTYFQDNFGQTHYLFFYGDNGSGKTINLHFLSMLGYRAMFDVDITEANIFTYYGSIEEGQGIILEDECDGMEYKYDKMKVYKRGNTSGSKVTRTETGGDTGRRQDGFFVYGFKAFSGEQKLDADKAKGFNERTFYLECQEGDPEYDLSEIVSPAGDEGYESLLRDIADLHKLLFAYRLIHHTDKIPNIDVQVKNREKQLTKPLLRLFQKAKCRDEIGKALAQMIALRRGIKKDTLESAIFQAVWELVRDDAMNVKRLLHPGTSEKPAEEPYDIAAQRIYSKVGELLGGTQAKDTQQSYDTPEHGQVSFKTINSICVDRFGAKKPPKHRDGVHLIFDVQRLLKVQSVYELSEEGIKIIEEEGPDDEDDRNTQNNVIVSQRDGCDGSSGSTESRGIFGENTDSENRQESDQTIENSQQNQAETMKPEEEGVSEKPQNRGGLATEAEQPSQPSQSESRRFVGGNVEPEDGEEEGEQ